MTLRPQTLATALVLAWGLASLQASHAASIALAGVLGSKALLVVDGSAPRAIGPGEIHQGVKLVSVSGEQAVVEDAGKRVTLRVGDAPVSVGSNAGAAGRSSRIVLTESGGGHFVTAGQINGRTVQFMVDTGATVVSLGMADAERVGVNYKNGQPVTMSTANGTAQAWHVRLNSVRVGDVEIFDVEGVVGQQAMPFVLLGNSFLSRFQMKRENSMLTLDRRF